MSQPTARFRHVDIGRCLYESLRAYFSVNAKGELSWLYKYCACILQPLVAPFQAYEVQRVYDGLIANSKFQIGQLTNVLNYLYDQPLNRIFITQGYFDQTVARTFSDAPILFEQTFADAPIAFAREFGDPIKFVGAIIHVPASDNVSALTATVAQMALEGLSYTIVTF